MKQLVPVGNIVKRALFHICENMSAYNAAKS
jgi:hypothetical protein